MLVEGGGLVTKGCLTRFDAERSRHVFENKQFESTVEYADPCRLHNSLKKKETSCYRDSMTLM